jgi:glycerol-1-phosphate dehydrogenase [NAD(P)+]
VATLTVSRLQHALLAAERPPAVRPTSIDVAALRSRYGPRLGDQCIAAFRAKALDGAAADRMNARLAAIWPTMTARLPDIMLPTARLRDAMEAAGAPVRGTDLGLSPDFYRSAVRHAREIRDRYSILDLAGDAGLLEEFVVGEG